MHRRLPAFAIALGTLLSWPPARAWTVSIAANGTNRVYLQVGDGAFTGGTFLQGGTPASVSTTNTVSTSVTPANFGQGAQTMTSDSKAATSFYDGATVCPNSPGPQVYIGGFNRTATGAKATLTVTSPANLVNAQSQTIPFSSISWTAGSSRSPDTIQLPAGRFAGGTTQTITTINSNIWFEDCYTFSYDNNNALYLSGTYTGQVTYTLTSP